VKLFTKQQRHRDQFLYTPQQLCMLHSSSLSSESPCDVRHPTRVSIEAAIGGAERHIYSIMYTKRHSANGSATRPFSLILHVTIRYRTYF